MLDLNVLNYKDKINIEEKFDLPADLYLESSIQGLEDIYVQGFIYLNDANFYACNLNVTGKMYLKDSVTLEKVSYDLDFNIEDDIPENLVNNQNLLDINELLWENIVLEEPIRYTKSDSDKLSGDNWQVISGKKEDIDPRMQKLYEIYKGGE